MTHPHHRTRHPVLRAAWRWFSGNHLDGQPRTDAGWIVPGTVAWTRTGRAGRWSYRPRLVRAAIRTGGTAAMAATAAGYALAPTVTEVGMAAATAAGTAYGTHAAIRGVLTHRHRRQYVRPLHNVLAGQLGVPRARRAHEWLSVPVDYATADGAEIRLSLPPDTHYTAELRKVVQAVVADKLGISELAATWHTAGREPYALFRPAPHPPEKVTYAAVRDAIAAAPESAPVIGLAAGGRPVAVDLDAEAPHTLLSIASGGGKSVLVRTIVAQLLAHGAQVVVLDAKRVSQAWLRDRPGVTYCRTAETAHHALIDLATEVDRRYDLIDAAPDDEIDSVDVGPRIVLVFEEMNSMIGKLNRYWQKTRAKSDPKTSPAMEAFLEIICMGRQGKVNCIAVAQLGTARTLGGPEVRESFSNRILGRYTVQAWKMLAGDIWPMPRPSSHTGRVQVILGGVATETQVAFLTTDEARDLAASGAVNVPPQWTGTHVPTPRVAPDPGVPGGDSPHPGTPARRYTLAQAARERVVPIGYEALKKARQRDPEFPAGETVDGATRYTAAELTAWCGNRPRAVDTDSPIPDDAVA